jgi:hypothetical protein
MIGDEIIEDAIGPCNGSNLDFFMTADGDPDSLWVWLNGQLIMRTDTDGFEIISSNGYRLRKAPIIGDSIRHRYIET